MDSALKPSEQRAIEAAVNFATDTIAPNAAG